MDILVADHSLVRKLKNQTFAEIIHSYCHKETTMILKLSTKFFNHAKADNLYLFPYRFVCQATAQSRGW